MFTQKIFLLSICLTITFANRCCQYHCSESACLADEASGCKWLDEDTDAELIVDGIQCRSVSWGDCGDCCPSCPPNPKDFPPPECDSYEACPISEYYENSHVAPGSPVIVGRAIEAAKIAGDVDKCKSNSRDCYAEPGDFGQDYQYAPSAITFAGVEWSNELDACCYDYISDHDKSRLDCAGKSPAQSHLVFDIDCDEGAFEIVSGSGGSSSATGYGLDGSTCFWGIKIDQGCSDGGTCDFRICLNYNDLAAGQCPVFESWVMDKASNVYSFMSLNGLPSCNAYGYKSISKHKTNKDDSVLADVHSVTNTGSYLRYTPVQMAVMCSLVVLLCAAWLYWGRTKNGEYKALNDAEENSKNTYLSV